MSELTVRTATAADGPAVEAMFERSTPHSRYLRFFSHSHTGPELEVRRISEERPLVAMVALVDGVLVGLGTCDIWNGAGEVGLFVEDGWQHHGVGRRLGAAVVKEARRRGISDISAHVLWDNPAPLRLMRRGFPNLQVMLDEGEYHLVARTPAA